MVAKAVKGCPIEGNVLCEGKTAEKEGVMVGLVLDVCLCSIGGLSVRDLRRNKPAEAGNGNWDGSGTDVRACIKSMLRYVFSIEGMKA